ncbi:MAG TPA: hypothetical protein PLF32_10195, partial [Bacteroidales bacterium]|nr:hypothetical protein [Bacteroidales bacterium]
GFLRRVEVLLSTVGCTQRKMVGGVAFFLWDFKAQMFGYAQKYLSCTKFQVCTSAHKKKQ